MTLADEYKDLVIVRLHHLDTDDQRRLVTQQANAYLHHHPECSLWSALAHALDALASR